MGFLQAHIYKPFYQNGEDAVNGRIGDCLLKEKGKEIFLCFESKSFRMWFGNLHFNKFPRCFPCIWELVNFTPFPATCERGDEERGMKDKEVENKETDYCYGSFS